MGSRNRNVVFTTAQDPVEPTAFQEARGTLREAAATAIKGMSWTDVEKGVRTGSLPRQQRKALEKAVGGSEAFGKLQAAMR